MIPMREQTNAEFAKAAEGMSKPRRIATAALRQLKEACLRAGFTEEELESDAEKVRREIATSGRYTPPTLPTPLEKPT